MLCKAESEIKRPFSPMGQMWDGQMAEKYNFPHVRARKGFIENVPYLSRICPVSRSGLSRAGKLTFWLIEGAR